MIKKEEIYVACKNTINKFKNVDNKELIIVKINNKIKFNLLYDNNRSLQKKIKIEQIRKEIN